MRDGGHVSPLGQSYQSDISESSQTCKSPEIRKIPIFPDSHWSINALKAYLMENSIYTTHHQVPLSIQWFAFKCALKYENSFFHNKTILPLYEIFISPYSPPFKLNRKGL
jgi:hypothetical protein